MRRFEFCLMIIPFLVLGCGGDDNLGGNIGGSATLGAEFSLNPGQQTVISEENLAVELVSVADSRCPTNGDIYCVWAGYAVATVRLTRTGSPSSLLDLSTEQLLFPNGDTAVYLSYTIRLMKIEPGALYPPRPQADYTATFTVVRQ